MDNNSKNAMAQFLISGRNFKEFKKKYNFKRKDIKLLERKFLSNPANRPEEFDRTIVHILHIGKTGGSAIQEALGRVHSNSSYLLVKRGHGVKLRRVPTGDKIIFFLRDPIKRFVSGFYSRKRQGLPRHFSEWTEGEKLAFEQFDTPNDLGKGMLSSNKNVREAAEAAMRNIFHVKHPYSYWLDSIEYLESRKSDIVMVGFQESLENDFERLKEKLGLDKSLKLPTDPEKAHRSPSGEDKHLDEDVIDKLRDWYKSDYEFVKYCKERFSE